MTSDSPTPAPPTITYDLTLCLPTGERFALIAGSPANPRRVFVSPDGTAELSDSTEPDIAHLGLNYDTFERVVCVHVDDTAHALYVRTAA